MTLTAILLLLVMTVCKSSQLFDDFKFEKFTDLGSQSGRAKQCKGSKQNFTIEWTPKEILMDTVHVSFEITPLMDFADGKSCINVYFEHDLLYQKCSGLSTHCNLINKYVRNVCPFRKGVTVKESAKLDLTDLSYFPNSGTYNVEYKLIGLDGTVFLCAEFDVDIAELPPDYE